MRLRRIVIILLAIIFCYLAYLEATAQEIATNKTSSEEGITTTKESISQTIDRAFAIICTEKEGGELRFIDGVPFCTERDHD